MSLLQISHNPDLQRLWEKGYKLEIKGAYLLVHRIPYLDQNKTVRHGTFVSKLDTAGDRTKQPEDHTMKFIGDRPYHADGTSMDDDLVNDSTTTKLDEGIEINFSFSRKPTRGHYLDYFEKIDTYSAYLLREVARVDATATPLAAAVIEPEPDDSDYPFHYLDTASAKAEINLVAKKLVDEKVAILGIGGTGSYVLDLVAKAPVREIHLYDGDEFSTHNAFRAPGAPSIEELRLRPRKVHHHANRYSQMHRRIVPHDTHIDASNVDQLREMTFVFICMDHSAEMKTVVEKLEEFDIPFIDVGMGLYRRNDSLGGKLAVYTSIPNRREAARENISFFDGGPNAEYETNIQIADLNALNACLAVIKWKKIRGFYIDREQELQTTYTIGFNMLVSEDLP